MQTERYDTDISLDFLATLPNWDESALIEYINRIAKELNDTRTQQIQLGQHVEQLSNTVATLVRRVGTLTHRHDQLDSKVCALVQGMDDIHEISKQAIRTAYAASGETKHLREDMFRLIDERLTSLQRRADELADSGTTGF